jgi:hypothetical protein
MSRVGKQPKNTTSPAHPFISMCASPKSVNAMKLGWRVIFRMQPARPDISAPIVAGLGLSRPAMRQIYRREHDQPGKPANRAAGAEVPKHRTRVFVMAEHRHERNEGRQCDQRMHVPRGLFSKAVDQSGPNNARGNQKMCRRREPPKAQSPPRDSFVRPPIGI